MFCVFLKELRQFRRSSTLIVMCVLSLLFSAAALVQYKFKGGDIFPQVLNAMAYLVAGLNQLAVITAAGTRWKNENGDGSLDIIYTTPISPLNVSCAKLAATSICAFAAFPIPVIVSGVMTGNFSFLKLLALAFMQILALSSVSLGCSTFQNRKSGSFDWIMLITVIALLPVVSLIYKSFSGDIVNDHFYAAVTGLAAIAVSGVALAVCGASPKSSNRALALKLVITTLSVMMPVLYHKMLFSSGDLNNSIGWWLFGAVILLLAGALFERKLQSRRVLAAKYSTYTVLFNTGVSNTFLLSLLLGTTAILLNRNPRIYSILAYMLLLTGICQLERGRDGKRKPFIAPTAIVAILVIASITYLGAEEPYKKYISLLLPWVERSAAEAAVIAFCGVLLYLPVCVSAMRQRLDRNFITKE